MSLTALEKQVVNSAKVLRGLEFGELLQRYHPRRREAAPMSWLSLRNAEVNRGPAIGRTLAVLDMYNKAGEELDTDGEEEYLAFIAKAYAATARIAGKCWAPIPADVRRSVFDHDDLPPAATHYIPGTRLSHAGTPLSFAGLNSKEGLAAIRELSAAARATDAWREAQAAAERLVDEEEALAELREEITTRMNAGIDGPETIGDVQRRWRTVADTAYEGGGDVERAARTIRHYNHLVQLVLWATLGITEAFEPTPQFSEELGSVRATIKQGSTEIKLSVKSDAFPMAPPAPFLVEGDLPVDGLYLSHGDLFQFGAEAYWDLSGERLGSLEPGLGLIG